MFSCSILQELRSSRPRKPKAKAEETGGKGKSKGKKPASKKTEQTNTNDGYQNKFNRMSVVFSVCYPLAPVVTNIYFPLTISLLD